MTTISEFIAVLSARMPELAWKLNARYTVLNPKLLPRGLFLERLEISPHSCIDEIYADLNKLKDQKNERSAYYLAERVSQKINVLVQLCQIQPDKKPAGRAGTFDLQTISTRQQWLGTLQEDITQLSTQHSALATAMKKLTSVALFYLTSITKPNNSIKI